MNISRELQTLIDAALQDGKLTEKEKQVLFKRAEKDGIDLDEFELYLNSRFSQLKNKKESFLMKVIMKEKSKSAESGYDIYRVWHLLAFIGPIVLFIGFLMIKQSLKDDTKYSVYLNQYDFEKARNQASKLYCDEDFFELTCPQTEAFVQIINTESAYLADNKEFDKAISSISEIYGLKLYGRLFEKGIISKSQDDLSDELIVKVILKASNHPEIIDKTKMYSYLSLIKNTSEFERVKNLLKQKK